MKGRTNNPAGRPKGTPNRLTAELRQTLKNVLAGELERIPKTFAELPARERLEMLVKLLPYIVPRVEPAAWHIGEPDKWDALEIEPPWVERTLRRAAEVEAQRLRP